MSRGISRYDVARVEDSNGTTVAYLHKRAGSGVMRREDMDGPLRAAGYEVAPYSARSTADDWPLLALVYRSPRADGVGRAGSTLYRVRCRRVAS